MPKYNVGDVLFCRLDDKRQKGRRVLEVKTHMHTMYKFANPASKSGESWTPEWMLYLEEEFLHEVKSGTLLDMQLPGTKC